MSAMICFMMCAVNIPFIAMNPKGPYIWMNWISAGLCFGLGIVLCVYVIDN